MADSELKRGSRRCFLSLFAARALNTSMIFWVGVQLRGLHRVLLHAYDPQHTPTVSTVPGKRKNRPQICAGKVAVPEDSEAPETPSAMDNGANEVDSSSEVLSDEEDSSSSESSSDEESPKGKRARKA
ncbi:hypothetical protein N7486_002939 [Penicillium sp. IBT 16267x]|nr:hypothetical protein N7486_002939 [Penicillium sp. IBT 16267x]